ncbi:MAG: hypothetical protein EOO82_00305, partial [Oxalobacteraceae bacterium]
MLVRLDGRARRYDAQRDGSGSLAEYSGEINVSKPTVPMTRRGFYAGTVAMAAATAMPSGGVAPLGGGYVFTYFRSDDDGRGGLRLALSRDGRRFANVRGGEPLFAPKVGEKMLMRDPSIAQDPRSGVFHMVW